jgi:two-component system sensor histidine kinase and response regulator WspE
VKGKENTDPLFIKNELQAHANILKVTLSQIKQQASNPAVIKMALKSFELMGALLQASSLQPLVPLFSSFQHFFEILNDTSLIEEEWLNDLLNISKNLIQLSTLSEPLFEKEILSQGKAIQGWIDQIEKIIFNIKQKSILHPTDEKQKQPEESPSPAPFKKDNSLIQLFLDELKGQAAKLSANLTLHNKDPGLEAPIKEWIQLAATIKQAAYLVKLEPIVEVARVLENYAKFLIERKIRPTQEGESACFKIISHLKDLAAIDLDHVTFFLAERKKALRDLYDQLNAFLIDSSPRTIEPPVRLFAGPTALEGKTLSEKGSEPEPLLADDFIDNTMFEIFQIELDSQCRFLNQKLIEFEKNKDPALLDDLMRGAHSIKGAARVISITPLVKLAHAMEDTFVSAQTKIVQMTPERLDALFQVIDFFNVAAKLDLKQFIEWLNQQQPLIHQLLDRLKEGGLKKKVQLPPPPTIPAPPPPPVVEEKKMPLPPPLVKEQKSEEGGERVLRITADNLNRLMGMAGESLIESRWLTPFSENLQKIKKELGSVISLLDSFWTQMSESQMNDISKQTFNEVTHLANEIRLHLSENLGDLESFIQRHENLSDRLYQGVINSRMRPFSDGVEGFPRMVRDLAKQIKKKVHLEIEGGSTSVDRDILEKLEVPLTHLIRNAIAHGIEKPEERLKAGKPEEGVIRLKAFHRGGMLGITISDDGHGIDIEWLRREVIKKNLISKEMGGRLADSELIDFLFLPGFSTAEETTELSGRGIGLNLVKNIVHDVGGVVRTHITKGKGVVFDLLLPLTLSVIRALLTEISGEAYAFPLAKIDQACLIPRSEILLIENREYFQLNGQNVGLIAAWEILELEAPKTTQEDVHAIVISNRNGSFGLVVDRLIGERELVLQELKLGKIQDIAAGALMEDGLPVLIIDMEEINQSVQNFLAVVKGKNIIKQGMAVEKKHKKSILVVDDSITVREVESRLLKNRGYEVKACVNGLEGWKAVRAGKFDLVITDLDMPRMNGIELIQTIKNDVQYKDIPIMIISYKDTDEDRFLGLQAGADYYFVKSSFHDTALLAAVEDLIGRP